MSFNKDCNLSKYIAEVLENKTKWNEMVPKKYNIIEEDNHTTIQWKIYRYANKYERASFKNEIEPNIEGSN